MTFCHFSVMSVNCAAALSPLGAAKPQSPYLDLAPAATLVCRRAAFWVVVIGNAFVIPVAMSALTPPFKDQHALARCGE